MQFLSTLENFCLIKKLNLIKVSLYKPSLTPFWPCPAKQQGIFLSFQLRGKTNALKGAEKATKTDESTSEHGKCRQNDDDEKTCSNSRPSRFAAGKNRQISALISATLLC